MAAPDDGVLGRPSSPRLGATGLAVLVTGVLVVATVGAALAWRARIQDDEHRSFSATAAQVERRVDDELASVDGAVRALAQATTTGPQTAGRLEGEVLPEVTADLPGAVVTVGVVEPASDGGLGALVDRRRASGLDDLQVRAPAEDTDEHRVVTFERASGPQPFFDGLDLAGIAEADAAFDLAAAEERLVRSGVLGQLPTDDERLLRSGFLVVAPVAGAEDGGTSGWAAALVDGEQMLSIAASGAPAGTEAELRSADGSLLATTAVGDGERVDLRSVDDDDRIEHDVEGLRLTVAQLGEGVPPAEPAEPIVLLVLGTLASVLLGALVWALARARASALALATSASDTLRRSEEQFRSVVQNLSDIVLLLDEAGTVRYASPSVRALLGWSPIDAVGSTVFDGMHPDDETAVREAMVDAGLRDPGRPPASRRLLEVRMRHADGVFRDFEATVSDVVDAEVGGLVFTAHDVSHRIATEERLAFDATHDPLTHLPNRTLLDDRLGHALDRANRTGADVAVLFIDLDGFKAVNDQWGHAAGDRVLKEVAGRIASTARASDTVARIGGDEFVLVCEESGSPSGAATVADRVVSVIGEPIVVGEQTHQVGASVGIALAREGDDDVAVLLRRADAAMYRAKQAGRGRVELDDDAPTGV